MTWKIFQYVDYIIV